MKKICKKYRKKEKVIKIMIEKCIELGYNIKESERYVEEFIKINMHS